VETGAIKEVNELLKSLDEVNRIALVYDGVTSINKLGDILLVGGNFIGFSGNSGINNLVAFVLSGNSISGLYPIPKLSISGVSDIKVKDNDIYIVSSGSSRSYKFTLDVANKKFNINSSWTPYFSKYRS
jgi:hypothetical protein